MAGKVVGGLVFAAVGSWLLPRWVEPTDSFASTLGILPWVLCLFWWIDRRLGFRPKTVGGPWILVAALVLTLPVRFRLGITAGDSIWAGAGALALGWAVWRRVPALRRRLGQPRRNGPRSKVPGTYPKSKVPGTFSGRPDPVFFLLPLAIYLASQPWALDQREPDGDEPYYLLLTHSLVHDGDVDLRNNYAEGHASAFMTRPIESQPGDPVGENGEVFSRHTAVLPLVVAPAYGLAGRAGVATAMALLTAGLAWQTLSLAIRIWPASGGGALLAWLVLAFSPPMLFYAHQAWIEVPASLVAMVTLGAILDLRAAARSREGTHSLAGGQADVAPKPVPVGRPGKALLIVLLGLALLPALKLRLVLVALPLLVLALYSAGLERRRRWALALVPLGLLLALLAHNAWRFGNPLKMYSLAELDLYLGSGASGSGGAAARDADVVSMLDAYARGALGVFYDSAFGLFANGPIWLLLLPAVLYLAHERDRILWLALGVAAPYWVAVAPRIEWYGGWSPPFRYPLVFLPLLALLLVPLLERRPLGTRVAASILLPITLVLGLVGLVVPGTMYNLADGGSYLLHMVSQRLDADVVRLFPSMVRPRGANWAWIALSWSLAPLALVGARRAFGPTARRLGTGLALVGLGSLVALVPWFAHTLPTRVVEAEDVWVRKTGGHLSPDRWTPQRPAYRGAWLLASRAELSARVVAGGETAEISILARRRGKGPSRVEVHAGGRKLGEVEVESGSQWQRLELGPVPWPRDAPLVLRCPEIMRRTEVGVLIDRIELDWKPAPTR